MRSKEAEIASLRDNVLSSRNQRQILVEEKRIAAAEELWKAAIEIRKYRLCFTLWQVACACYDKQNIPEKFKEHCDFMLPSEDEIKKISDVNISAHQKKIFIPPLVWAYFSALETILIGSHNKLKLRISGTECQKIFPYEKKLLIALYPSNGGEIEENPIEFCEEKLSDLEEKLLTELQNFLDGKSYDENNAQQAKIIMEAVNSAKNEQEKSQNSSASSV